MSGNDVLSQDEIDALLHGVDSGAVPIEPHATPGEARSYDFANQVRIVRGRMPTLEMINERFARLFRTSLFNMLRRTPEVAVAPVKMLKFSEYVHTLHVPTSLNLVRTAREIPTLLLTTPQASPAKLDALESAGVEVYQSASLTSALSVRPARLASCFIARSTPRPRSATPSWRAPAPALLVVDAPETLLGHPCSSQLSPLVG